MRALTILLAILLLTTACGEGDDQTPSTSTTGGEGGAGGEAGAGAATTTAGSGGMGGQGGGECDSELDPEPGLVITTYGAARGERLGRDH